VISTAGSFKVPAFGGGQLQGTDQDLIALHPGNTWSIFFDGSVVGLTNGSEDISAAWIDANDDIYLAAKGNFSATGANSLKGDRDDIFVCAPLTPEPVTNCTFSLFFDGDIHGLGQADEIDALSIGPAMGSGRTAQMIGAFTEIEVLDEEMPGEADDPEMDEYDMETREADSPSLHIFLPLIQTSAGDTEVEGSVEGIVGEGDNSGDSEIDGYDGDADGANSLPLRLFLPLITR
jgi:hypothetical protein